MQRLRNRLVPRKSGVWKRNSMHLKWHWTNPAGIMRIPHKWCRQANQHGAMPNYRHLSGNPNHSQPYDWIRKSQMKNQMKMLSLMFSDNMQNFVKFKFREGSCLVGSWSGHKSFCGKEQSPSRFFVTFYWAQTNIDGLIKAWIIVILIRPLGTG